MRMSKLRKLVRCVDWRVLAALLVAAVVLGIANNFRVYEEQRLSLFSWTDGEGQ